MSRLIAILALAWTCASCLAPIARAADAVSSAPVLQVGDRAFSAAAYRALAMPELPKGSTPARLADADFLRDFSDRLLLLEQARRDRLQDDPEVAARIRRATDTILADAAQARLGSAQAATAAQLRQQYLAQPHDYDELHLRHVFVALHPQGGPRSGQVLSEAQALDRARALKRRIDAGGDFAELAARESDDAESAADGGRLSPTFQRYLDTPFAAPVMALADGQVSEPVRGPEGYHLILLESRIPATFEHARGQIAVQLREQAGEQAMQRLRAANPVQFDRAAFDASTR